MLPEKNFISEENLRMENQQLKNKLTLEHGAVFSNPGTFPDLPPEIENQFLKNVEAFEKTWKDAKQISIYEFIGKPQFRKSEVIPDHEIQAAKDRILDLLFDNQMSLDTICNVDDREIYRFVTEELFMKEIDDLRIPGWNTHFIYEEFHPNHEYDIKDHSADFITSFLNKDSDFYNHLLSGDAETEVFLKNFRASYTSFGFEFFRIDQLIFDKEEAFLNFEISFTGLMEGSIVKHFYCGSGEMELRYIYDYWCVHNVKFPSKT